MTASEPPIIGLTTITIAPAQEGRAPRQGQNQAYIDAVVQAGGAPLLIPHLPEKALLRTVFDRLAGLLLPGGEDLDPGQYGEEIHEKCGAISAERDATELSLVSWASAEGKPILAICRGIQVLNVGLGGSLYQDLTSQLPTAGRHDWYPGLPRSYLAHTVSVEAGTRLASLIGAGRLAVNSLHHQAAKEIAPGLVVAATAPDGVVEALEASDHPFALGVQWHPEELVATDDRARRLFRAFVQASRER